MNLKNKDCRIRVDYTVRAAMGLLAQKSHTTTGELTASLLAQVIEQAYPEILSLLDPTDQDRLTGVKYWTHQRLNVTRPGD